MSKYIIRVECLEGVEKLDADLSAGVEVEGYCLLAKMEEGYCVSIMDMSVDKISDILIKQPETLAASVLAKAKSEVCEIMKEKAVSGVIEELAARMGEINVD